MKLIFYVIANVGFMLSILIKSYAVTILIATIVTVVNSTIFSMYMIRHT
ncbi:hypothetical protein [Paucilactobacillus nenjiangensis]|nr:hypothetical protein [Paucilactobacillus nenjiangensis]